MFNFIVCDDNDMFRKNVCNVINKLMIDNDIDYKIHSFNDYNESFFNLIKSNIPFKIYILDIETPTKSGIDASRIIRQNDLDSIIIFLTSHEEMGMTILKNELLCLSFINKFDNYEEKLSSCINKAIKIYNRKQIIRFEEKGVMYTIDSDDIIYITRDSIDRKSIIMTDYMEIKTYMTLLEIKEYLNDNFVQTHRACYINKDKVFSVCKKTGTILFKNGLTINLLSRKYKKGILE